MRGRIILFITLLALGWVGCTTSVSEIGTDFFKTNDFDVAFLDSITIRTSTVLGDSIITSNASRLLVGYHKDPKLGSVTSAAIFQVGTQTGNTEYPVSLDKTTTQYQSVRLWLKRDKYSYYDTTKLQTINAYRLTKPILHFNGFTFNRSKFTTDATPLGSVTFDPRPHRGDSLEIPLSDTFGKVLMAMATSNDPILAHQTDFLQFLRGFALVPDSASSGAIMGFTLQPELRLYYTDQAATPNVTRFVSWKLGTNFYFNNIHSYRDGTPLDALRKPTDFVSSSKTDNEVYFQGGVGLYARVEMPYLRTLLFNDRSFQFSRAFLEIMPVDPSLRIDPLPTGLSVYIVDGNNKAISPVGLAGILVKDTELNRKTHYQIDITGFVNSQIQNDLTNDNALLVLIDDATFRSTVNSLALGDQKNFYQMKVKLYYLTLSNESN